MRKQKTERTLLLEDSHSGIESTRSITTSLLKSVASYSLSNIIYYGGLFGSTVMMSRLDPDNPTILAATGLMATTEAFGLHTIWAAEFSGGIFIGGLSAQGQHEEVGVTFLQTILYGTMVAAPVSVLFCFTKPIYQLLGQTSEVSSLVQNFTRIFAIGAVPFVWLGALEQFALGIGHRKTVVAIPLVYVGSYLLMAYPLTYGKWGLPKYGVEGVAIARSISSWLTTLGFYAYFKLNKKNYGQYHLFNKSHWKRFDRLKQLFPIGSNIAIQVGSELAGLYTLSLIAGALGDSELGAYQANLQYLNFMVIIPITIAQNIAVEIGMSLGGNDDARARKVGNIGMILSLSVPALATIASIVVVASSQVRDAIFSPFVNASSEDNHHLLEMAGWSLLINSGFQFADSIRNTASGALRGYQDTTASMLVSVINMLILTTGLGWLMGDTFDMETEGLFLARGIAMVLGSGYLLNRWVRRSFEDESSFASSCYNFGRSCCGTVLNWPSNCCAFFSSRNESSTVIDQVVVDDDPLVVNEHR